MPPLDSRSVPHMYTITVTVSLPLPRRVVSLSRAPEATAVLTLLWTLAGSFQSDWVEAPISPCRIEETVSLGAAEGLAVVWGRGVTITAWGVVCTVCTVLSPPPSSPDRPLRPPKSSRSSTTAMMPSPPPRLPL